MNIIPKRKLAIKNLYISIALITLGTILYFLPAIMFISTGIGVAFFCSYIYLSFKYWKCPECGQQFPVIYSRMDQRTECWHCLTSIK